MIKKVLAVLMALVALCAFAVAEETADDWVKTGDEPSVGDSPEEMWNKTYGGTGNDLASEVHVTKDGGYVIIGVTESYGAGDGDAWLIKTDSEGNEEWNKTFGGPVYDNGQSVQETSDDGYVLVGRTESYGAGCDLWLIKTDSEGNEKWSKTFGGPGFDGGWSVQETKDGDYIITGETESYGAGNFDLWLIKTDSSGNEIWNKTFGGPLVDWGNMVHETRDGGYIISGETESYGAGGLDIWLIKTDLEGNEEWNRTFGGPSSDSCRSVIETRDAGYMIAGGTHSYGAGGSDLWVVKTDSEGKEEWNRTFGEPEQDMGPLGGELGNDQGLAVQQTSDGGYIIAGYTSSYGAFPGDLWIIKMNSESVLEWDMTSGRRGTDEGASVQETSDGEYIVAGDTTRGDAGGWDILLVKLKK
ncbi:MAG: hypothetical protein WCY97_01345 [Methanothrix sp.]|jgi:predicted secreted protein|uniref:Uncharacterized protein n=1 Tax=Methanothrix harundinacea TaxID=301375 RepID=A0A101FVC1_9EURY|nr:MAG: Uncharacterized protein XD72_0488 [Methanothrix harundinacea]KUK97440.1 MAG: Uncharacterized protein XE07_0270 [Methanothrix harundinacea]MDD3709370.1 hypothetical protein [Methanothrix sp.]MDD5767512.1 hypothetical protein [Methanothrix sp.]MDI9398511.1 hypothetical protein [Euryarchaeota archaeon]